MVSTLPSNTSVDYSELAVLSAFKHALKSSDQLVFDELSVNAGKYLAETAYAAHTLPLEIFMRAMILDEPMEVSLMLAS